MCFGHLFVFYVGAVTLNQLVPGKFEGLGVAESQNNFAEVHDDLHSIVSESATLL